CRHRGSRDRHRETSRSGGANEGMARRGPSIMSDRYSRQTVLPEVGEVGQGRLRDAPVVVVGAGGLGCAVLQYLCAAGVGRLTIVDHDCIEESNLHRQPLYRVSEVGLRKASTARKALGEANPHVSIHAVAEKLTPANATDLVN